MVHVVASHSLKICLWIEIFEENEGEERKKFKKLQNLNIFRFSFSIFIVIQFQLLYWCHELPKTSWSTRSGKESWTIARLDDTQTCSSYQWRDIEARWNRRDNIKKNNKKKKRVKEWILDNRKSQHTKNKHIDKKVFYLINQSEVMV